MKIESRLNSRSLLLIQGCLLSFIALLFVKSAFSSLILVGIVDFGLLLILIYHIPNLVLPLFLISLFWGNVYFRNEELGVTISDLLFVLLTAGYLCSSAQNLVVFFLFHKNMCFFDGLKHSFGAHNNYLNALCEIRLVGVVAFFAFFTLTLRITGNIFYQNHFFMQQLPCCSAG